MVTILLLFAALGNTLAAFPPHQVGAGGCEESCCETARQSGPSATISGICCIVECPQAAETLPIPATDSNSQLALLPPFVAESEFTPSTQRARFPSAPTRYLHGSSSRYLDVCSFLL